MKHIKAALITGIIFFLLYLVAIFLDYYYTYNREITLKVFRLLALIVSILSVYFFAYKSIKSNK